VGSYTLEWDWEKGVDRVIKTELGEGGSSQNGIGAGVHRVGLGRGVHRLGLGVGSSLSGIEGGWGG
jgi:hypothetical protein